MSSKNEKGALYYNEKQKQRLKALEIVEKAKELEHLKNKPIKYLLKK